MLQERKRHTWLSPRVQLFLLLSHFNVVCDLLLNRRNLNFRVFTATQRMTE